MSESNLLPWCAYVLGHDLTSADNLIHTWWRMRDDVADGTITLSDTAERIGSLEETIRESAYVLAKADLLERADVIPVITELTHLENNIQVFLAELSAAANGDAVTTAWDEEAPPGYRSTDRLIGLCHEAFASEPLLASAMTLGELIRNRSTIDMNVDSSARRELRQIVKTMSSLGCGDWIDDIVDAAGREPGNDLKDWLQAAFITKDGYFDCIVLDRGIRASLRQDGSPQVLLRITNDFVYFLDQTVAAQDLQGTRLDILCALAAGPNRVISRAELNNAVYGAGQPGDLNSTIHRLRDVLKPLVSKWLDSGYPPLSPSMHNDCLIESIKGVGYRLALNSDRVTIDL